MFYLNWDVFMFHQNEFAFVIISITPVIKKTIRKITVFQDYETC